MLSLDVVLFLRLLLAGSIRLRLPLLFDMLSSFMLSFFMLSLDCI